MAWLKNNLGYVIGVVLLVTTVTLRIASYPIVTADYTASLQHWMNALSAPGLIAFSQIFSNYPPLYLYLLKLLTFIPAYDLYSIKTLSLIFDIVLAFAVFMIVRKFSGRAYSKPMLFMIFAIALSIPTVFINSSLWGQSDAIYSSFVLFSLYFMLSNRPVWSAAMFGVAISFKLQAIFFAPVLIGYLLLKRRGVYHLLIIPAVFVVTLIPAMLGGGSFNDLFLTYVRQMGEFKELTLFAPSIYSLINEQAISEQARNAIAIVGYLASAIAAIVLVLYSSVMFRMVAGRDEKNRRIILISLMSVLLMPFLLPHMHERYFYLADVISLIYAAFNPKRWFVPVIVIASSFFSYMPFLSGQVRLFAELSTNISIFGAALLLTIIYLGLRIWRKPRAVMTM